MRYARVGQQVVDACDAPTMGGGYSCPYCGGRVFLREGRVRDPHFAHYEGEGTDECDEYHPGLTNDVIAGQSTSIEHEPNEGGLCVQLATDLSGQRDADWALVLRLSALSHADLAGISLQALQHGGIDVYADDERVGRLSGLELRPGAEAAAATVPPTIGTYRVVGVGQWPDGIDGTRWNASVKGLAPGGTLFRFCRGEWLRLREDSLVRWSEGLLLVADARCPPPAHCFAEQGATIRGARARWDLWRIRLPDAPNRAVETWLRDMGHAAAPPISAVTLLSVPRSFAPGRRVAQLYRGDALLARVIAPHTASSATVTAREDLERTTAAANLYGTPPCALVLARASRADSKLLEISADDGARSAVELIEPPNLEELRIEVANLPRLSLSICGRQFEPWRSEPQRLAIAGLTSAVEVRLEAGLEGAKVNLIVAFRGKRLVRSDVTLREAENCLSEVLTDASDAAIEIDAGGLGRITARFTRVRATLTSATSPRRMAWIGAAAGTVQGVRSFVGASAAVSSRVSPRLCLASIVGVSAALNSQLRALSRRARARRGPGR